MSEEVPTITFNGIKIPVEFGYKEVINDFKRMGLNLLELFTDDQVILTIMANDAVMLQIWYHYVSPHAESFESAIDQLTPANMHQFKEVFWQQVVNFTAPPMRPLATGMWKKLKEQLKSPEKFLENLSETSLPKQE